MNKVMKLSPLHKQPVELKNKCWHLLDKYFCLTTKTLVLISFQRLLLL